MATLLQRHGIFRDSEQPRKTLMNLNHQRSTSKFCDVVLRVCGTRIFAHASVLAAASPYFVSFLGTGSDFPRTFSQKQPQVIEIHIDSMLIAEGDGGYGEAVDKVVDYMYTNEITITTSLFSQIMEIARIMLLDHLIFYCEEFQKGINGNYPKDVSTCTSTLKEVFNLLAPKGSYPKGVDAQTETEEILFDKVKGVSPIILGLGLESLPSTNNDIVIGSAPNNKVNEENYSVLTTQFDIPISEDPVDKNNDSLIFPPLPLPIKDLSKEENIVDNETKHEHSPQTEVSFKSLEDPKIQLKPAVLDSDTSQTLISEPEHVEDFNAIKSFEDILDYDVVGSTNQSSELGSTNTTQTQNEFMLEKPQADNNENVTETVTEGELEDISDLVTFDSSISVASAPSKPKARGTGAGRPRGRGRQRGRPKKRGRGRPRGKREVHRNQVVDAESDYEFEEFISKLEKGESVELEFQEKDVIMKDAEKVEMMVESEKSVPLKKSDRIRSRPSQYKKDYILHSLSRKTRKKYGRTLQDRVPIPSTQKVAREEIVNSLRFVCQKCDFSTTVFKNYVSHLDDHPEPEKKYVCDKCGFVTSKSRQFTFHKENHMTEDFICVFCNFQASDLAEYAEHKLKHSGDFPYFCNECDSRFKKKCQLESHKPKHWLQRPFTCPICNAGFKWKHALKNHMIVHTTVKDHLCDICGYATAHKSMLTAHRLIHTGETLKCSVEGCSFEATKRQMLKMHMLTHTREKPHQCEVCGQRFSLAKNMRRHLLLHTNTRPYACKICSFTTTRYDKLKEHNHKLHNIGGPPVPKKPLIEEKFLVPKTENIPQTATIITAENITLNPDGTISAESLQKIAELAAAQQNTIGSGASISTAPVVKEETIVNITTQSAVDSHGNDLPIIAHIHYSDSSKLEVMETENVPYFQEME